MVSLIIFRLRKCDKGSRYSGECADLERVRTFLKVVRSDTPLAGGCCWSCLHSLRRGRSASSKCSSKRFSNCLTVFSSSGNFGKAVMARSHSRASNAGDPRHDKRLQPRRRRCRSAHRSPRCREWSDARKIPTCPASKNILLQHRSSPSRPVCAQIMLSSPTTQACPTCTRLSILAPRFTRVSPTVARSTDVRRLDLHIVFNHRSAVIAQS